APAWKGMRPVLMFDLPWGAVPAAAYCWGRYGTPPKVRAEPTPARAASAPEACGLPSDYSRRPVAYIHGSVAITREELGEYLIARFGKDRLKNLINKRIIEHAARQKGVEVAAAEVQAALKADAAQ